VHIREFAAVCAHQQTAAAGSDSEVPMQRAVQTAEALLIQQRMLADDMTSAALVMGVGFRRDIYHRVCFKQRGNPSFKVPFLARKVQC